MIYPTKISNKNIGPVYKISARESSSPDTNEVIPQCLQMFFPLGCYFTNGKYLINSDGVQFCSPIFCLEYIKDSDYFGLEASIYDNEAVLAKINSYPLPDMFHDSIKTTIARQGYCNLSACDFVFKNGDLCYFKGAIFSVTGDEDNNNYTITVTVTKGVLTLKYYSGKKYFDIYNYLYYRLINSKTYLEYVNDMKDYEDLSNLDKFVDQQVSFDVSGLNLNQLFYMLSNYIKDPGIVLDVINGTNSYRNTVKERIKRRKSGQQS